MEESDYAELGPPDKSNRSNRNAKSKRHAKKATKPPKSKSSKHGHDQDKDGNASSKPKRTNQSRGLPKVPGEVNYNRTQENNERKSRDIVDTGDNKHVNEISPKSSTVDGSPRSKEDVADVAYAMVKKKRENVGREHSTHNNLSTLPVSEDKPKGGSAKVDVPAERTDISDDITYAKVQRNRTSRKTKQSKNEDTKALTPSDRKNVQEPTSVETGDASYATIQRKKDGQSRNTQKTKEGSHTLVVKSDENINKKTSTSSKETELESKLLAQDVSHAIATRKREEKELDLDIKVHGSLETIDENTSNMMDGYDRPSHKPGDKVKLSKEESDLTKSHIGTGLEERFPKGHLSTGNNLSQVQRQKWSSERRDRALISRDANQRDGIIVPGTISNHRRQQQHNGIKRSVSLQERRPGSALLQVSISNNQRAATISSNHSNKSSISSLSRVGKGSLRRDSRYDLIPEEPDKPLPVIESLESPHIEGNTSPSVESVLSDDVIGGGGHVNKGIETNTSTSGNSDVLVPCFEDEGYRRALSRRVKTKARERRKKKLLILLLLILLLLVVVIFIIGGLAVFLTRVSEEDTR